MKKLVTLASVSVFLLSLQGASLGQEKPAAPAAPPPPAAEKPVAPKMEQPAAPAKEAAKEAPK